MIQLTVEFKRGGQGVVSGVWDVHYWECPVCSYEEHNSVSRAETTKLILNHLDEAHGCAQSSFQVEYKYIESAAKVDYHKYEADIKKLTEAIRFTVEYVGVGTLPAKDGWSWYDAMKYFDPVTAAKFRDEFVKRYPDLANKQVLVSKSIWPKSTKDESTMKDEDLLEEWANDGSRRACPVCRAVVSAVDDGKWEHVNWHRRAG